MARQNMAMFERTLRMFTPFGTLMNNRPGEAPSANAQEAPAETAAPHSQDAEIADLKAQIDAMRRQLDELANRK